MNSLIPSKFITGITGAELLKVGTQVAEDAGIKWTDDWQYKCKDCECWENVLSTVIAHWIYRINPDRLKPAMPRVGTMWMNIGPHTGTPVDAIELTNEVREALQQAGVEVDDGL